MTFGIHYSFFERGLYMTEMQQITDAEVFLDVNTEWRTLNKLLDVRYRDYINRLAPTLFTGDRAEVFRAMQLTFIEYGTISYEGIHKHLAGNVPGQLTAATQGDILALVDQLLRLAKKRQIKVSAHILEQLSKEYDPDEEAIRKAIDFDPIMAEEDSTLHVGVQSFMGNLHAKISGVYTFARTGFKFLDRNMGGEWKPKGLILLAGGVGSGKTTLWVNSAKAMAKGIVNPRTGILEQTASLFISLEMSREDLLMKMVANELNIDSGKILSADLEDEEYTVAENIDRIERKMVELQQLPMYIIDNGRLTLAQMVYEIRKHINKHGVRVVAIDYLQIVNHHPTGNDNHDLGEFAEAMKQLAKRENITIILLSQVNRGGEGINSIRDSGEVQAIVDVALKLTPEDEDAMTNTGPKRGFNAEWLKNRYGAAGRKVPLLLNGPCHRFEEGS